MVDTVEVKDVRVEDMEVKVVVEVVVDTEVEVVVVEVEEVVDMEVMVISSGEEKGDDGED